MRLSFDPGSRWYYMYSNPVLQVFMSLVGLYMSYTSQVDSHVLFGAMFMLSLLIDKTLTCPQWVQDELIINLQQEKEVHKKRLKRYRYRRNRKLHSTKFKKFRRRSLPYHIVMRCRRRGGNKPNILSGHIPFSLFKRHLSTILRNKLQHEKRFQRNCNKYVESVFKSVNQERQVRYLDPTKDLGGVPRDLYVPFLDLHNPLLVNTPTHLIKPKYSNLKHNMTIASYFRVNEFSTNAPQEPTCGYCEMPLIWDTGASIGLTPFKADFIDYQPLDGVSVKDIARQNKVLGVGTTLWKFVTRSGREVFLPLVCYHVEHATIRLMSPQQYIKQHGGSAKVLGHTIEHTLPDGHIIDIPVESSTNLPIVRDVATTKDQQDIIGPKMITMSSTLHDFDTEDSPTILTSPTSVFKTINCLEVSKFQCLPCVGSESNQQLSGPQKELLLWHWKLGINMRHVQELMRDRSFKAGNDNEITLPPIIPTKYPTTKSCKIPMCMSCELAKMKARKPKVKTSKHTKATDNILKVNSYEPGDMISSDQFNVHTPGRKLSGYGREALENGFHGGTIYVDSASGLVQVNMQVSMGANETLIGKNKFEQWVYDLALVTIKRYHSDNGV